MIFIQHLDLRRSNAIYIFRSVINGAKTYQEISKCTETAEITVKKIVYKLIDAKLLLSFKNTHAICNGRPKAYLAPNPDNNCTLITKEGSSYVYYTTNAFGQRTKLFTFPTNYHLLNERNSLSYSLHFFKQTDIYNSCQRIFYLSEEELEPVEEIEVVSLFDLILKSLDKEEKVFYLEYKEKKAIINHSKVKLLNQNTSIDMVKSIIDLDDEFIFSDHDKDNLINEALRIITLNILEEKVAQLF